MRQPLGMPAARQSSPARVNLKRRSDRQSNHCWRQEVSSSPLKLSPSNEVRDIDRGVRPDYAIILWTSKVHGGR